MATVEEAVRRLTLESRSVGVKETARDARDLTAAVDGVAVASQRAEKATASMETRLNSIQRRYDAQFRAQQELARVERELAAAQGQGLITAGRRLELLSLAAEKHGLASAAVARETAAVMQQNVALAANAAAARTAANAQNMLAAANDNSARFRRQNLAYQAIDIGQGVAMGAPLGMIAAQQSGQILQLYAAQGGLNALWKDAIGLLGGLARAAGPWIAGLALLYTGYRQLASFSEQAKASVDDATAALAAQASPVDSLSGRVSDLQRITDAYAKAIRGTAKDQGIATASIISNSEREFNAKKALLELELKRQQAAIAVQQAEAANLSMTLRRQAGGANETRMNLPGRGFADPRIGSVPFVRLPDATSDVDFTGMKETLAVLSGPMADQLKELRANIELSELATLGLKDALKVTFDQGVAQSIDRVAKATGSHKTEAEKLAEKYDKILKGAEAFIATQMAWQDTVGLSEEATAALRYEQDLLNQVMQAGVRLTPQQAAEIRSYAAAMADAEFSAKRAKEAQEAWQEVANVVAGVFAQPLKDSSDLLDRMIGQAGQLGEALAKAFKGAGNEKAGGLLGAGLSGLGGGYSSQSPILGAVGGAVSGFSTGAALGAGLGPIGAVIGGIGGLLGGIFGRSKREREEERQRAQQVADAMDQLKARAIAATTATNGLSDQLKLWSINATAEIRKLAQAGASASQITAANQVLLAERAALIANDARDKLSAAYEKEAGRLRELVDVHRRFAEQINATLDAMKLSTALSNLNPAERLGEARSQFEAAIAGARRGDASADVTGSATRFLEEAMSFYSGSTDYFAIFEQVQQALKDQATRSTKMATDAEKQLGRLDRQVAKLLDIETAVKSVTAAMRAYQTASLRLQQQQAAALSALAGARGHASGAAFLHGAPVAAFAAGGVIGRPTLFPMANGAGLMGEAGPEAIMPLRRTPDGRLGVAASNDNGAALANLARVSADGSGAIVAALRAELGAVRAELAELKRATRFAATEAQYGGRQRVA